MDGWAIYVNPFGKHSYLPTYLGAYLPRYLSTLVPAYLGTSLPRYQPT